MEQFIVRFGGIWAASGVMVSESLGLLMTQATIGRNRMHALGSWGEIASIESEFESWDWEEQIAYVHSLGVQEDRLARLVRAALANGMNVDQRLRYAELQTLVDRHHRFIARIRR